MNKKILFLILSVATFIPLVAQGAVACLGSSGGIQKLTDIVNNVTFAALVVGSAMAVIGFVTAGIMYLTSAGGERMNTAKKALIGAVIGTFLVVVAQGTGVIAQIFCAIIK